MQIVRTTRKLFCPADKRAFLNGGDGGIRPPLRRRPPRGCRSHLAVPEKPFGLTPILRFFDRCGNCALPFSAPGSGSAQSPRHSIHYRSGSNPCSMKHKRPTLSGEPFVFGYAPYLLGVTPFMCLFRGNTPPHLDGCGRLSSGSIRTYPQESRVKTLNSFRSLQ